VVGPLEALGHHAGQRERDAGVLHQRALEVGALEDGARRLLDRNDAGVARLAGDESHLAEHLARAQLGEEELDS
jgi:hypothetical protein